MNAVPVGLQVIEPDEGPGAIRALKIGLKINSSMWSSAMTKRGSFE